MDNRVDCPGGSDGLGGAVLWAEWIVEVLSETEEIGKIGDVVG